eukprot:Unigene1371_Nuclearia_a/m.4351 Unigene1371_Nuclearia_a/g.4351  ORF Unigene1371_Nuclearia_a/g.4351 Unigene1371_Nuclearia_a/m.4351 type:complete len:167 (+) Unigene1371_Nuclearia_a:158-658(+)
MDATSPALDESLLLWTTVDFTEFGGAVAPLAVTPDVLGDVKDEPYMNETPSPAHSKRRSDETGDEDIDQEEKRRRNSAASARFRLKKKMREQKLESMTKIMSEKTEVLQRRVRVLESEVKYLRDLLTLRRDREREAQIEQLADKAALENAQLAALEPPVAVEDVDL